MAKQLLNWHVGQIEAAFWKYLLRCFAICHVRHFENGHTGVKFGQIFIVEIIISLKEPARIYKMSVLSCYDCTNCLKSNWPQSTAMIGCHFEFSFF